MSFIKLDRKIAEWEWFTDSNTLKLWIYLLVNAQYQDSSYKGIEVKRGQLITGRKKLAEQLEMSEQQIRTCLDHLQATNEITIKPTNKYSLITIEKYGLYQGDDDGNSQQNNQQDNQRATNKQPTNNHNKRNKEIKNIRNKEIYIYSGQFLSALDEFKKMRKTIKKPLTVEAEKRLINRLKSLSTSEEEQIQMLNNATDHCWLSVYALKKQEEVKPSGERYKQEWLNEE